MDASLNATRGGYPLTQLLVECDIRFETSGEVPEWVEVISTDSRSPSLAGGLFVALVGERFDGHDFVMAAQGAGAVVGVVAAARVEDLRAQGVTMALIGVGDTGEAFGALASAWRQKLGEAGPLKVVAVGGSNGKTTTKEMIAAILGRCGQTLKTEANHNNQVGLPQTLLRLRPEDRFAVVELGTNRPGEMAVLTRWARPDVVALTCIQPEHLEGFGSLAGVYEEELSMLLRAPAGAVRVVPASEAVVRDDERLKDEPLWVAGGVEEGAQAAVRLKDVEFLGVLGQRFKLAVHGQEAEVTLPLLGVHNVQNAAVAAAAAIAAGAQLSDVVTGLENMSGVKQRMTPLEIAGRLIINDAYNANPGSMQAALRALKNLHRGRWIAVLGEMRELGEATLSAHVALGREVATAGVSALYAFGPQAQPTADTASIRAPQMVVAAGDDPAQAAAFVAQHAHPGDAVLLKGSRGVRLERVLALLPEAFASADASVSSP